MGLIVSNVSKSYSGKKVVNDISFEISKPGVFGLLGANGAGKTTTLRMMLGILKKDSGTINWNGKEVSRDVVNFGYMPEERGLYPKVKISTQLEYFSTLKGVKKAETKEAIKYWFERLDMNKYLNMTAQKLSKGNQQKIQFILSVMHDPELIILDEPFSGLDPVNTELLKDVIIELVKKGKYIVMSGHQMNTIEEFCEDIIILKNGETVVKGNLKEIKNEYPVNKILVETNGNIENIIKDLKLDLVNKVNNLYIFKVESNNEGEAILKRLIKDEISVVKFEMKKPTLNDIFIEKVGEAK